MRQIHKKSYFTPVQVEELAANQFTAQVNTRRILYTLEFKNLFLSLYEQDHTSIEIFMECGYDPDILGNSRIYGFARRLREQINSGKPLTEALPNVKVDKPVNTDYNTLPAPLSVSAMQRELIYLRQQVAFLKKLTELDNDQKPRT